MLIGSIPLDKQTGNLTSVLQVRCKAAMAYLNKLMDVVRSAYDPVYQLSPN